MGYYERLGGWLLLYTVWQVWYIYKAIIALFGDVLFIIALAGYASKQPDSEMLTALIVAALLIICSAVIIGLSIWIAVIIFKKPIGGQQTIIRVMLTRYAVTLVNMFVIIIFINSVLSDYSLGLSVYLFSAVIITIDTFIWAKYFTVSERVFVYFGRS